LSKKPSIVCLNKIDSLAKQDVDKRLKTLKKVVGKRASVLEISALAGIGLENLKKEIFKKVEEFESKKDTATQKITDTEEITRITLDESEKPWIVEKIDKIYVVKGKKIEGFARRTDYDNEEAVGRLKDIMRKTGIMHELERKGVEAGDKVYFGEKKNFSIKF